MLRTFQVQNMKKIRTFNLGSAWATKLDVLISNMYKKRVYSKNSFLRRGKVITAEHHSYGWLLQILVKIVPKRRKIIRHELWWLPLRFSSARR